jgi:integrase/recombinase XerD
MYKDSFINHLKNIKKASANTIEAYSRDIEGFRKYIEANGAGDFAAAVSTDITGYMLKLKGEGKSASTINRKLASLRAFYSFLADTGRITKNPAAELTVPRTQTRELEYLSVEEIENLLALPDGSATGIRDRAILEIMYATGMRVNELIQADTADVNTVLGFISFDGSYGKARIVPMGRPARQAVETYIREARPQLLKDREDSGVLFLNYYGQPMTRQGLWKIISGYGEKAGFEIGLTPHILRNSFAVHMIQNGADIKSLQELMGHEDITAMQIYMNIRKNRIKDVYDSTHPRA